MAGGAWVAGGRVVPGYAAPDRQGPVSSPARVADALLAGKDAYEIDREVVVRMAALAPVVLEVARAGRAFLSRAVAHVAGQGVHQFLEVGVGLPRSPNTHEVARAVHPGAAVVYVDHDPSVVAHARVLLPDDKVTVTVHGDIRDPGAVLTDPEVNRVLDLERPVGVVFGSVLSLVADADDPAGIVAEFVDAVAPGSYVVISHPSPGHGAQEAGVRAAARLYSESTAPMVLREAEEVTGWFAGLNLVTPGVVPAPAWRPAPRERGGMNVPLLVGTGRIPR